MEDTKSCRGSGPDPFCTSFCIQKISGDLHHLLARGPINILRPFSDKDWSTRRLICGVLPKVWCRSQKALNKVTFLHSKDTRGVQ